MRLMGNLATSAIIALIAGGILGGIAACNHSAAAGADSGHGDAGKHDDARAPLAAFYDAGALDEQIPATSSEDLTTRAKHLLEAIAHDNPDLGADMLFPREAYIAARDVQDPGRMWDRKMLVQWNRRVHQLHKRRGMERAQFVSLELGHAVVQSVPKRKDWKKPCGRCCTRS